MIVLRGLLDSMINFGENKVICDMKNFCFLCKANSVLENSTVDQIFYYCTACGKDILCDVAIVRQFDNKKMIEKCPKCRGKLKTIHFPLNKEALRMLNL